MSLGEEEQTRLYEKYWSAIEGLFRGSERVFDSFARDFMALHTRASRQVRAADIYRAFRDFYPAWRDDLGDDDVALSELLRYARYYAAFSIDAESPDALANALSHLRQLVDVPAILVMRLFDCHDRLQSLSTDEFIEAIRILESYTFRRAICGLQTHSYWQVFANIAYRISDEHPLDDLKVALARQRESYRFPTDDEFESALLERDVYGLRVCRFLLERLENDGSKEPSDTSTYSIEHIMPQNPALPREWRTMLGEEWESVHKTWLHRLGNLTLTGYNSTYSDRPFEEKKTTTGGFEESAVRLNHFVREQSVWNEEVIEQRGKSLTAKALGIWRPLEVDQGLIDAARERELRELADRRDVSKVRMSERARALFEVLSARISDLDETLLEIAEKRSVSYYDGTQFVLEVLPRKYRLVLLLPLEFHEVDDPRGIARDASQQTYFAHAQHEGGVAVEIDSVEDVEPAMPLIQQARSVVGM